MLFEIDFKPLTVLTYRGVNPDPPGNVNWESGNPSAFELSLYVAAHEIAHKNMFGEGSAHYFGIKAVNNYRADSNGKKGK